MAIELTLDALVVVRGQAPSNPYTPPVLVPPADVSGGGATAPFNAPRASGGGADTPPEAYVLTFDGGGA